MIFQGLLMLGLPFPDTHGFATLHAPALRGHFPRMDNTSLGIINIRLKTVNTRSDPAVLVHKYLEIYFHENPEALVYRLLDFEITPEDPESLESHQTRLDNAVVAMERCAVTLSLPPPR
jgi:hypothetical protein